MKFFRLCFFSLSLLSFFSSTFAHGQTDKRGERVYKLCTFCHGDAGEGRQDIAAPAIAGLPEWYLKRQLTKFYEGVRGTHPKDMAGMRMNPMARTLEGQPDIEAVSKYVAAMPKPAVPATVKGRIIKGEAAYKVCISCHGDQGQGNEALGAPPLAGASDWYLVTQLNNFKHGIRAGDPARDPTGAAMTGMASALSPEAILDVVSYISTFKSKP